MNVILMIKCEALEKCKKVSSRFTQWRTDEPELMEGMKEVTMPTY